MKKIESKAKVKPSASDRRGFMKTLFTGTVAAGLASTIGKAEAATPAADECVPASLGMYFQEKNARSAIRGAASYFEFDAGDMDIPGFPGGGIWVAVGPDRSEGLKLLRELLDAREHARLGEAIASYHQRVTQLVVDQRSPYASMAEIPVLAEITYAGKLVTGGMFVVPGSDVMLSFLPYNGGSLNPKAFQLIQYALPRTSPTPLEAVVIARKPVLTDLEKSIFERIPEEVEAINLGDGGLVANWGLLAAGVVLAAVYYVGTYVGEKVAQNNQQQHDEQQKQMEQEVAGNDNNQDDAATTDDKNNGGSLRDWMNAANIAVLEQMEVTAAATKLLQLRSNLVQGKLMATE